MSHRSLILAGGGLKVGYQAGVLQVWLDEAGLTFDHADGASGGCFNLAMYCQGMTGTQIADNWRNLDPFLPVDVNLSGLWPTVAVALHPGQRSRPRVSVLELDFDKIRHSNRTGTFNVFNFSKKQLEVVPPSQMTEDHPGRQRLAADVVPARRRSTARPTSTPSSSPTRTSKKRCGRAPTKSGRSGP